MKIYTVIRVDQYGNDFALEIQKLGVFLNQNSAIDRAKAEYRNLLADFRKETERIATEYDPGITEAVKVIRIEEPEMGFYDVHFEVENDREYHHIHVVEWIF